MRILVDAMGGDNAPKAVIKGAIAALKEESELELILVGDKDKIQSLLAKEDPELVKRIELIHASSVVLNSDHPSLFLKTKADSSMAICFEQLRSNDDIGGFISAGPTGALLTGSILRIGRLEGVHRPALLSTLPTRKGHSVYLLDSGANVDSRPEYLVQFALMGDVYLKSIGLVEPRIALLNIGSEEGKGNELIKSTFPLIQSLPLNFVGNVEPDHVQKDEVDLVVADGFHGNILLKGIEGGASYAAGLFKHALKRNIFTKFVSLFLLHSINKSVAPLNKALNSCAPLLGTKKLVVKCHGKGKDETFRQTIVTTYKLAKANFIANLQEAIAESVKKENENVRED